MYRPIDKLQHSFLDFNQPKGVHMNPDNRWVKLTDRIPWDEFDAKYARLFPSGTGNVAKPLRMALRALTIQIRFQYSDRELVDRIAENPYPQYFIGLPGFQEEAPLDASILVLFRKRISAEILMEANEYLPNHKDDDKDDPASPPGEKNSDDDTAKEDTNKGTLTIDATCLPANIRYPQDVSLLNEAREKLENIIYRFCKCYSLKLPRRYCKRARKEYLAFAKSKEHTSKKIRNALRKQLAYVKRYSRYLEQFMSEGYAMTGKDINLYLTIIRLYEQQQYMYDNRVHSVEHRIVSISQPWSRPIIRGKVKALVEFGVKFDLSLDSEGYGRIEKISFEAYNESTCLIEAIERFKERTGYYPERVLADQIYRTRENRSYCKEHGIRLSGPKLGNRCYGMSCITTKLQETQMTSIALSVFVTNLFRILRRILYAFLYQVRFLHDWNRYKSQKLQIAA